MHIVLEDFRYFYVFDSSAPYFIANTKQNLFSDKTGEKPRHNIECKFDQSSSIFYLKVSLNKHNRIWQYKQSHEFKLSETQLSFMFAGYEGSETSMVTEVDIPRIDNVFFCMSVTLPSTT